MTGLPRLASVFCVLMAVSSLLTSCVSIPESSDVSPGRGTSAPEGPELINNVPPGPSSGQSQLEVVQGFYAAMLAYPQTATIAREFLTPKAAASWSTEGLHVYEDQELVQNAHSVSLLARSVGRVDSRGSWTSLQPAGVGLTTDLRLRRVEREWRIVNPQPGSYVSRQYFDRYYDPFSLYFMDPTGTVLAPDPVYMLLGDTTATALVSGLLQGPTKRLAGVLSVSIPRETVVDVSVSTSAAGVAEVPLSEDFLQLSEENRQLFAAQLTWTLRQVPEIEQITLSVDGSEIEVPGVGQVFGVNEFAGFDPAGFAPRQTLFALGRSGLVEVTENATEPVFGSQAPSKPLGSAAVSVAGTFAALVPTRGSSVIVETLSGDAGGEGGGTWFSGGDDLLKPSWDVHDVLWLVDRTPQGAKLYTVTKDRVNTVRAPKLEGAAIESFAVSRDGLRLAAIVRAGNTSRLVIALINRNPLEPARVAVESPVEVTGPGFVLAKGSNLAWASPTSVVALTGTEEGMPEPVEIAIDGSTQSETGGFLPARPVTVAAGPNDDAPIAFGTANGRIYVRSPDLLWPLFGGPQKLRAPFYPG
ncbi:MAG: LpqB family beta-propeller domain-containing protein [Nocardioidaceae bacterium]